MLQDLAAAIRTWYDVKHPQMLAFNAELDETREDVLMTPEQRIQKAVAKAVELAV